MIHHFSAACLRNAATAYQAALDVIVSRIERQVQKDLMNSKPKITDLPRPALPSTFPTTTDAHVWAREFYEALVGSCSIPDREFLTVWFAAAIDAGKGSARAHVEPDPHTTPLLPPPGKPIGWMYIPDNKGNMKSAGPVEIKTLSGTFAKKPPLGVKPRVIWLEQRRDELIQAIVAYNKFTPSTPDQRRNLDEWIAELGVIHNELSVP